MLLTAAKKEANIENCIILKNPDISSTFITKRDSNSVKVAVQKQLSFQFQILLWQTY